MGMLGECTVGRLHAEARSDLGPAIARAKPKISQLAQGNGKCDEYASERRVADRHRDLSEVPTSD